MKAKFYPFFIVLAFLIGVHHAAAQGTAFTYQGRLNNGGSPASGLYDFRFKLYADPFGSFQVGSSYLTNAVPTTNGLFTTTIDFGVGMFIGTTNWLEVDVRTNGGGGYTVLSPLQNLTPTPYAIFAQTASNLSGTLPAAQLGGTLLNASLPASPNFSGIVTTASGFSGNGAGVTNVNAASLGGLASSSFWQLGGNNVAVGQFLGSTNNQPVIIVVNGQEAERFEQQATNSPNIVGGYAGNFAGGTLAYGVTIGGGGEISIPNSIQGTNVTFATIGGGVANTIKGTNAYHSAIGGGSYNNIAGDSVYQSTIAGGSGNSIFSPDGFIGGGRGNSVGANTTNGPGFVGHATVGGGYYNQASGVLSFVGGGLANTASGPGSAVLGGNVYSYTPSNGIVSYFSSMIATGVSAVIVGGMGNQANGDFSLAAGYLAQANHSGTFVWADSQYPNYVPFGSTTSNEFSIRAQNGVHIQTDKGIHLNAADEPLIVRDWDVFATNAPADKAGIGRWGLFMEPLVLTIGIPSDDVSPRYFQVAKYSTNGNYTTLMQVDQGGNVTANSFNVSSGGFLGTLDDQPLVLTVNGQEAERFEPTTDTPNVVGGYSGNYVQPGLPGVTISGGGTVLGNQPNIVTNNGYYATIAGGYHNTVTNYGGAILGGSVNLIGGSFSGIGVGQVNTVLSDYSWIGSGYQNTIQTSSSDSVIGGGSGNTIQSVADHATIAGGYNNAIQTNAWDSTIAGGYGNIIEPFAEFAAIGGGENNDIQPFNYHSTIAGGALNMIQTNAHDSVIAGGYQDVIGISANNGVIGGGYTNTIQSGAIFSTIGGGQNNVISAGAQYSTIPGGIGNDAAGNGSFAAGSFAQAANDGSFVWADAQGIPLSSTAANQFLIRAQGGVGINTNHPTAMLHVAGEAIIGPDSSAPRFAMKVVHLGTGGTVFTHPGDTNLVMIWDSVDRILTVTNSAAYYYDVQMQVTEENAPAANQSNARDIQTPSGPGYIRLTNSITQNAGWNVTAIKEGNTGPGFQFNGSGYNNNISGLITYWY